MSSRILQQDSSLLLTQANEPLINDNFIATDSISTGSPAVSSTSLNQDHSLQADSVSSVAPCWLSKRISSALSDKEVLAPVSGTESHLFSRASAQEVLSSLAHKKRLPSQKFMIV